MPAEEYGDIAWRVEQARAGKLEFLGGKPELLRLGHFDDVDLSMMIHTTPRAEEGKAGEIQTGHAMGQSGRQVARRKRPCTGR